MNKDIQTKKEKIKYCKLLILVKLIVFFLFALYLTTSILLSIYLRPDQINYLAGFGYSIPILFVFVPFLILSIIMYIENYKNWNYEIKSCSDDAEQKKTQIKTYKKLKWFPIYILFAEKKYDTIFHIER